MRTKIFKWSLLPGIGFLLLGTIGLTACKNQNFTAAIVRFNKSEIHISVGGKERITASVSKGYEGQRIEWISTNEPVAVVDEGYVFGTGEGEATIRAFYAGGSASCKVIVGEGGGESPDAPKLALSDYSKSIKVGDTFNLTVTEVYPADTTVTFSSSNPSIIMLDTVDPMTVTVTGMGVGSAGINVKGSKGQSKVCQVTVSDGSTPTTDYDIAVPANLNYKNVSLTIGTPKNQKNFMNSLLADFNRLTGSSVSFTTIDFEEDNGTSNFPNAKAMPSIFPYASDQTMALSQFGALSNVPMSDVTWIEENMGEDAVDAATFVEVVGYPFSSDNGLVMFYDKSAVSDPSQIDTMPKLLALATSKDMEVNYNLGAGFYIAPALMSYNGGQPLYEVTPDGTSYTAEGHFACDNGLKAAKDLRGIANHPQIRPMTDAPRSGVLATITDSSKVKSFKTQMGNNYAVAPLPKISNEANSPRLGSFLGYKFYGVNLQLSKDLKTKAYNVAKFLCSEYAQHKRFVDFCVRPTLKLNIIKQDFKEAVMAEPHIAALVEQSANNGVIPMAPVSAKLWSQAMVAYKSLKDLPASATDAKYLEILKALDKGVKE